MDYLVSIIMPCYNSEDFLEASIQSVIKQTYQNWELIIVDDCSDDNSYKLIEKWTLLDFRIKLLKTNKKSGSASLPRNIAISNAKGRFIAFLDSDDLWMPNKLEKQIELLLISDAPLCYSGYLRINEEGRAYGKPIIPPKTLTYNKLLRYNYIGCLTVIYDSNKLGKLFFPPEYAKIYREDYAMWLKILKIKKIAVGLDEALAIYRIRGNSISSNKYKMFLKTWDIYRKVENINFFKSFIYITLFTFNWIRKEI